MKDKGLSDSEMDLFRQVKNQISPTEKLEDNIVESLKNKNLINAKQTVKYKGLYYYLTAAVISAFIIGYFSNQIITEIMEKKQSKYTGNEYILFLYENDSFAVEDGNSLVREYMNWGEEWGKKGKLSGGEKLGNDQKWIGEKSAFNPASFLSGYFIIRASDYDEALKIAESHPHTRYGGAVEIRLIEKLE